jgi:catechol 2,3-dioxygenase-like lactoylglutathione lyase family enzyme
VFDHVTIRVSDRDASQRFYDTVLEPLGLVRRRGEIWSEWGDFSVSAVEAEHPLTKRLHVAFRASDREAVDAFWRAGVDAGYRNDGEPGLRPRYTPEYYGSFLRDPDGNSVEAVIHETPRRASIDHVWIRVGDLDASRRFYEAIAPWGGYEPRGPHEFGVGFEAPNGGFSLIPAEPGETTEHVHLAFPATDNQTVEAFHRAALSAGYRDNGGPGERPVYHPGYYGAFVLDPDGNNVEVVNHNR